MKILRLICLAATLAIGTPALAAPASEASIRELLEVSHARQMMDQMYGSSLQGMFDTILQSEANGREIPEHRKPALNRFKERLEALMREKMGWQVMEPDVIHLYASTFTQEEVEGMVAFYRTPAGQAVIEKMPQLMQNMMPMMRKYLQNMIPQMQAIEADLKADIAQADREAGVKAAECKRPCPNGRKP